jgi:hypothetical protein
MIPYVSEGKPLFISQLSIDVLRDIYTFWDDKKIYNYSYKGGNETKGKINQPDGDKLIVFF